MVDLACHPRRKRMMMSCDRSAIWRGSEHQMVGTTRFFERTVCDGIVNRHQNFVFFDFQSSAKISVCLISEFNFNKL